MDNIIFRYAQWAKKWENSAMNIFWGNFSSLFSFRVAPFEKILKMLILAFEATSAGVS